MNIWLPHIPKNGGITIFGSLLDQCIDKTKYIVDRPINKFNKQLPWLKITNKENNKKFYGHHNNPLDVGMEDWLKILIVREPIDRLISLYNFEKLTDYGNKEGPKFKANIKKLKHLSFDQWFDQNFSNHLNQIKWSHLDFLNYIQILNGNILRFDIKNVFTIFDYIIDITKIDKAYSLIEENFLQRKIQWKIRNSAKENLDYMKKNVTSNYWMDIFTKDMLSNYQLEKIKNNPCIKSDLEFYKKYEKQ